METKKTVCVIIGTRAQLIKMAPVIKEIEVSSLELILIYTGQHQQTFPEIEKNFRLPKPDYILYKGKEINSISKALFWFIDLLFKNSKLITKLNKRNIDYTLVHGDTFSTVIGAIIGKRIKSKVCHIESGLRSFNIFHPFPEEINRLITFKLSDILFCPGKWAVKNVENLNAINVNTKGNTILDSLRLIDSQEINLPFKIKYPKYAILSIHRFETIFFKKKLKLICDYASDIALKMPLLFILHPPTERMLRKKNLYANLEKNPNIQLYPRLDYFSFNYLLCRTEFVITDGGSNQEECYHMNIPCLLFREKTERKEGLGENVVLSKFDRNIIEDFVENYKERQVKSKISLDIGPSQIIIEFIKKRN